jgi:hypothetical protein
MDDHFQIVKESFHENDGHHFFVDNKGKLVVADHSINTDSPLSPKNANDGVLYVDFNRPLEKSEYGCYMPLIDSKGTLTRTIASVEDALFAQDHMQTVFTVSKD